MAYHGSFSANRIHRCFYFGRYRCLLPSPGMARPYGEASSSLKVGDTFDRVATNPLNEPCDVSPSVAEGHLYLRTKLGSNRTTFWVYWQINC